MLLTESKPLTLKIPSWVSEEKVVGDVERLLEEKYGIVSIQSLREKFKVETLREDIPVDEQEILSLRESEKKRLQT
ncbi:MAG: hypothetical protein ACOC6H_04570 [Thermoproteota archaeon]